jgi:hypothetical protein
MYWASHRTTLHHITTHHIMIQYISCPCMQAAPLTSQRLCSTTPTQSTYSAGSSGPTHCLLAQRHPRVQVWPEALHHVWVLLSRHTLGEGSR